MAGYQTGHAELMRAAGDLETGNADLMQQLSQFISAAEGIAGSWQGAAATAFQNLQQRFANDSTTLNNKLLEIAEQVSGTATAYQAQEDAAQSSLSNITNALG
jgi:WXG100 family type VII secretion target